MIFVPAVLVFLVLLPAADLRAQTEKSPVFSAYYEAIGVTRQGSLNVDFVFGDRIGFRAGFGARPAYRNPQPSERPRPFDPYYTPPPGRLSASAVIGATYLAGAGAHRFETAAVLVLGISKTGERSEEPSVGIAPSIGYRYYPSSRGVMLRANASPVLRGKRVYPSAGISFGIRITE